MSIRGFGARSAFGVRGVRVLQDGVPLTLPDGQTPVDVVDVEGAERVEVVRGSASSLYGNAAGGVIDVRSAPPSALARRALRARARWRLGADHDGRRRRRARSAHSATRRRSRASSATATATTPTSARRAPHCGCCVRTPTGSAWPSLTLAARLSDVDRAQSPGAITRAQMDTDPRSADPLSVRKQAGKTVRQGDLALTVAQPLGERARARRDGLRQRPHARQPAHLRRRARRPLERWRDGAAERRRARSARTPCASRRVAISSGRTTTGRNTRRASTSPRRRRPVRRRRRSAAICGRTSASSCRASVPFVRGELALAPSLLASAGVRADAVRFRVHDRLITATNPDDSGDRTLHAVSPAFGLVWRTAPLASLYATVSSSFETPTTTELGNKPDGSAGINPELRAAARAVGRAGRQGTAARRRACGGKSPPSRPVRATSSCRSTSRVARDAATSATRAARRGAAPRRAPRPRPVRSPCAPRTASRVSATWTTSSVPRRTRASGSRGAGARARRRRVAAASRVHPVGHGRRRQRDGRGRREQRPGRRENDPRAGGVELDRGGWGTPLAPRRRAELDGCAERRVRECERDRRQVLRACARSNAPRTNGAVARPGGGSLVRAAARRTAPGISIRDGRSPHRSWTRSMRRSLVSLSCVVLGLLACHSARRDPFAGVGPLAGADAIVEGRAAATATDTIDAKLTIRLLRARWALRTDRDEGRDFWSDVALLDTPERRACGQDDGRAHLRRRAAHADGRPARSGRRGVRAAARRRHRLARAGARAHRADDGALVRLRLAGDGAAARRSRAPPTRSRAHSPSPPASSGGRAR